MTNAVIDRPTAEELSQMLARYVELDQAIKPMVEERDELKAAIKAYIEEYGEPVTIEGWAATVREKNKPAEIDLISAAQKQSNDEHIVRAASMGLLKANLTPLRALSGKAECADILLGYLMPAGVTTELRIERVS